MKVAVTGSEGLIGSLLVEKLKDGKHSVVECTRENCNILDPSQLKKMFRGAEAVVHCAAVLDEDAKNLFEVNVAGTENVLEAAAANGAREFIFLSTAGVYGSLGWVKDEKTEPRPETAYEMSKLEAEKKVLSYQEVFHITILRPALVLGKNRYWKQIISTIKKGFPLIGSGENKWQLACAQDVAGAIVFCLGKQECYGETFIVAEKQGLKLAEIAGIIRKELGMKGEIGKIPVFLGMLIAHLNALLNFNPLLKPAYVKRLLAERGYSTKKLESLGWKAKHSTREELPKIVNGMGAESK